MGDADAFAAFAAMVLVAEGDESMLVLKPDRARGLEARRVEAQEFVEEEAACRIDPAFRHELKLRFANQCGIIIPHAVPIDRGSGRLGRIADVRRERLNVASRG